MTSTDRLNGIDSGLAVKAPCAAVAIANITLSGLQTVNGVAVVSGDRVLVTAQTSSVDNGIYVASTTAWARAADFDGNRDVTNGTIVTAAVATSGRNPYYQVIATNPVTIGSSAINFRLADGPNVSYDIIPDEEAIGLTAADINDSYEVGDSRRYGALFNGVDDSAGHQLALDVLEEMGGGTWIIEGGISKAQGLVCKASYIEIVGSGWLEPVSNASPDFVLQLGDDASATTVTQAKGHLRIGDQDGAFASWTNIEGLRVERMNESDLRIDIVRIGVGLSLVATGGGVAYNTFHLGDMSNNKVSILISPAMSSGFVNENLFIGGRFTLNTGTWVSGAAYIKCVDNSGEGVNGNIFIKPSFEGRGRILDADNFSRNKFVHARWEGTTTGTPNVDFDSVLMRLTADCTSNDFEFSHGLDWTAHNTVDHGACTRVSDTTFTIPTDLTSYFFPGNYIVLTVGGQEYSGFVMASSYSDPDTTVRMGRPIVTGNPTAVATQRITDAGTRNRYTVGDAVMRDATDRDVAEVDMRNGFLASYYRSSIAMSPMDGVNPCFSFQPGSSDGNKIYSGHNLAGTLAFSMSAGGHNYVTRFSVGNVTTPIGSQAHIADPAGGAVIDAESRTAIASINARLEAFGLNLTS